MLIVKHTVETTASADAIWHVWQDVPNWNTWDHGIEYSTIKGPFQEGTTGAIKPKDGPLVHTVLTKVEPMKLFVDEAKLFLAKIVVSHYLTESKGKRLVTHQIEMTGPLAFFFSYVIGRNIRDNLSKEMREMVKKAEHLSNL